MGKTIGREVLCELWVDLHPHCLTTSLLLDDPFHFLYFHETSFWKDTDGLFCAHLFDPFHIFTQKFLLRPHFVPSSILVTGDTIASKKDSPLPSWYVKAKKPGLTMKFKVYEGRCCGHYGRPQQGHLSSSEEVWVTWGTGRTQEAQWELARQEENIFQAVETGGEKELSKW